MLETYVPMFFKSLNFDQLKRIENRAIHTNDNTMRTSLRKAAHGDLTAQREVMEIVGKDPTWIIKPAGK